MGAPVQPSYTQTRFRFRNDDGSESAATWKATENTSITQAVNQVFRLRIQVAQTVTNANQNLSKNFKVRFSRNGGAYTDVAAISATTAGVRYASSANVSDGTATTSQLTAASGTFLAGRIDNNNDTSTLTFNIQQYTDLEFVLELYEPQLTVNDTLDFRVYETDNTVLNTYTQTARVTAQFALAPNAPTLSTPIDNAEVDFSQNQTFTWQFNSDQPGDSQTEFAFRRKVGGAPLQGVVDTTPINAQSTGAAISPAGGLAALCGNSLYVLDTSNWTLVTTGITRYSRGLAFSNNGSFLATVKDNSPDQIIVYNTSNWSVAHSRSYGTFDMFERCAFSPNNVWLAAGCTGTLGGLVILTTADWQPVSGIPTPNLYSYQPIFSPDSSLLALHAGGGNLFIYDTSNWSLVDTFVAWSTQHSSFSPNGTLFAYSGESTEVDLIIIRRTSDWGVEQTIQQIPGIGGYNCRFSPDGSYLAVSRRSSYLKLYDTTTWAELSVADLNSALIDGTGATDYAVPGFDITPDSNYILFAVSTSSPLGSANRGFAVVGPGEGAEYWNGTDWQTTEVLITSANGTVTIPAAKMGIT